MINGSKLFDFCEMKMGDENFIPATFQVDKDLCVVHKGILQIMSGEEDILANVSEREKKSGREMLDAAIYQREITFNRSQSYRSRIS